MDGKAPSPAKPRGDPRPRRPCGRWICKGEFKTASANLMQVCTVLGVRSQHLPVDTAVEDAHRQRLEAGVLEIWDRTPQDARRILKLLRQLPELRRTA